jgi:hypothetical protein
VLLLDREGACLAPLAGPADPDHGLAGAGLVRGYLLGGADLSVAGIAWGTPEAGDQLGLG